MLAKISAVWESAISQQPDLLAEVFDLMVGPTFDLQHFYWHASASTIKAIMAEFRRRYGDKAMPVANFAQAQELEHYAATGVVVPQRFVEAARSSFGNFETIKARLADTAYTLVSPSELTASEKKNLDTALAAVELVEQIDRAKINVVNFVEKTKLGLWTSGEILLAKKVLDDPALAIEVLIHEFSHSAGPDGDRKFTDRVAALSARIIAALV
jgi:hypothetical protein